MGAVLGISAFFVGNNQYNTRYFSILFKIFFSSIIQYNINGIVHKEIKDTEKIVLSILELNFPSGSCYRYKDIFSV